jgi:polyferredoxin
MRGKAQRQRLRAALILLSFLLFPVTLNWFSPALILEGAASGVIVGSFLTFTAQLATALFFGRAFCGWACPGAGIQEALFAVNNRPSRRGWRDGVKWVIWVPWVSVIALLFVRAGGVRGVNPLLHFESGISVAEPRAYVVYFGVLALIFLPAVIAARRGFCHSLCWMAPFMIVGTKLRDLARLPGLRLHAEAASCKRCGTCGKNCPMSLDVPAMVASGSMRHAECILCATCVDGCPQGVIRYALRAEQ